MKKIWMTISALFLVVGLAACGNNNDNNDNGTNNGNDNAGTTDTDTGTTGDNSTGMDSANNGNDDNTNGSTSDSLQRDEDAAAKVETVEGVEVATVLLTDENAYVAAELAEGTDETEDLKTKIRDQVKEIKPEIGNVYVSADPDFAKELSDYGNRIDEGEPVEGFFDEFSDAMKRMFPDAK